jgi:hypothetical protein
VALKRVDSEVKEQVKEVDETKQQEVKQQSEVNEVDATKEEVEQVTHLSVINDFINGIL